MEYLNSSFDTRFELPEEEPSLGKKSLRIRDIISHQEARNTGFTVKLDRVQYGTYKKQRACLISFKFLFFWPRNTNIRIKFARITIRFCRVATLAVYEHQEDDDESDEDDIDIGNVPGIICLLPERIYGEPDSETRETTTGGKLSVSGPAPSPAGGCIEVSRGTQATRILKQRMSIEARMKNSAYKLHGPMDTAIWSVAENSIQRDGIPPNVHAGLVLRWPASGGHVLANITVEPELGYPLYEPWQVRTALKLRQQCKDPIAFDGETAKNDPVEDGKDFGDESFDWTRAVTNQAEYSVS
ncbi:hypothetical protein AbraIFM66951_005125 [Aspergillus brasiliensis]|uniref:Uncharacterized protein n=1 Tax=Aspergillus brasiliensis TaxID=319629 RepID=A0A9W5YW35_9EURO|nr:hypothetical protein AbraCBS73388_011847 [Aspergillus brasiliensis]GKZ51189.1 hypothetical protein AbraIFM66951_005125 [Aspergillus brasiliensis]